MQNKWKQKYIENHLAFLNFRRHWQLLLWPGTSNETTPYSYDTQFIAELWPISQNGDLCNNPHHLPTPIYISKRLQRMEMIISKFVFSL